MDPQAQLSSLLSDRYTIEREIGAGGMATVYLARDLKHNRRVALKVLKPELGAVLGVERFLSEIQVTANLQHPHLLPLFDSGEAAGLLFYVMPFIEGESLRDRLDRERQLPVDEAVRIVAAVASALDYAHRQGVIHRDLKPENILLQDGQPVVADFGIALAVSNAGGARVTQTGLSLGTPQYMSPEQATGDRVLDARTDIYSLGAVAYEMLVGDPPYLGSTAQAIIAKVLTERPPSVRTARPTVPEHVEAAISRALEKLPADRWATAHEFADVLSGKTGWTGPTASSVRAAAPRSRAMRALPWLIAAAGVAFAVTERLRRAPADLTRPAVTRAFVQLPDSTTLFGAVAISADGHTIAFVAVKSLSGRHLYVRASDGIEFRAVTDPIAGMNSPALSPDGSGVVFMVGDSVLKSAPLGSAPTLLVRLRSAPAGPLHWDSDGQIVIASGRVLLRVPAAGGAPDTLLNYPADGPVVSLSRPRMLLDGKAVLFTAMVPTKDSGRANEIHALNLANRTVSTVVAGRGAHFVEPGFLTYVTAEQTTVAQAFDPRTRKVSGPTAVLFNSALNGELSPNGVGVLGEMRAAAAQFFSVSGRGAPAALPIPGGDIRSVRFDREGRRLLHGRNVPDGSIFVTDLALGTNTMILPRAWKGYDPLWSPDGRSVTFHENWAFAGPAAPRPTLGFDGFEMSADGSGVPRQLFRDSLAGAPQAWLPDGKLLSRGSMRGRTTGASDLFVHTLSGDTATSVPWLHADWDERSATASPDGRFIAFVSRESGHDEVTVRPYPDPSAGKWVISETAAQDPVWSRDGKTLYYWEGPLLRAARLRTSPTFAVVSRETVLTDANYHRACCFPNYDVSPDGKRIILARLTGDAGVSGFVLVTNWGEEIRARLAAAGRP